MHTHACTTITYQDRRCRGARVGHEHAIGQVGSLDSKVLMRPFIDHHPVARDPCSRCFLLLLQVEPLHHVQQLMVLLLLPGSIARW